MSTDRWSRPMIDRVSEFLIPSSKSKLDRRSTRPMIRYDVGGLGILAALERSDRVAGSGKPANPIPVHNNYGGIGCGTGAGNGFEEMMTGFDHHVTCSNGGMNKDKSIFSLSSSPGRVEEAFPAPGFLSCCNLCRTRLCGKDIYMYRGEKAFCSEECREVQIVKDEKKQGFRSQGVSRSAGSSYVRGQRMVSTGIFAIYIFFFSSMLLTDELRSQCLLRQMILCM